MLFLSEQKTADQLDRLLLIRFCAQVPILHCGEHHSLSQSNGSDIAAI